MHSRAALPFVLLLAAAGQTAAADRWEAGLGDDSSATGNELRHATRQESHDFDDPQGADWAVVVVQARRSYEARGGSGNAAWQLLPPAPDCPTCARIDRVSADGTVLTAGVADSGVLGSPSPVWGTSASVRWTAAADGQEYVRVLGNSNVGETYDLDFFDTSYLIPRFNNSGTQATVILVQNGYRAAVNAQVHFYDSAGTLLHSQPLSIPAQGSAVLNTSAIGALQGVSGTAVLSHDAPYGTLAGKAVALEPATGFTFDTPMQAVPR
jgi:hypothetical protein